MPRPQQLPTYRHHKPSHRAVVTLCGKDHYLGDFNSPESKVEYQRLIAEWLVQHKTPTATFTEEGLTIAEVIVAYLEHAQTYYKDVEGEPTHEIQNVKIALRPLEALYATKPAKEIGPLALKAVRQKLIADDLCRGVINQRISIVKRMFKWASGEELIPAVVFHGLMCVQGLRPGRSEARETVPVRAASDADVDAILPHLTPTVCAMVQLQRMTGMRTGELIVMRGVDIDTKDAVWYYRPAKHKTAHHGHARLVAMGPQSQRIISPFLNVDSNAYLFSPAQAKKEWYAAKRKVRKTSVQRSQLNRGKHQLARSPGAHYDRHSYHRAIQYAIKKARKSGLTIQDWHPHQLRHTVATRIRKQRGLDAARAVLGHKSLAMTETYAEIDAALATQVAADFG